MDTILLMAAFTLGVIAASGIFILLRVRDGNVIVEASRVAETELRLREARDRLISGVQRKNHAEIHEAKVALYLEGQQLRKAGERLRGVLARRAN